LKKNNEESLLFLGSLSCINISLELKKYTITSERQTKNFKKEIDEL